MPQSKSTAACGLRRQVTVAVLATGTRYRHFILGTQASIATLASNRRATGPLILAAYDIGSGITKCEVAKVDWEHGLRRRVLFSGERHVLLHAAMARSGGTAIGPEGLADCEAGLKQFKEHANSMGAVGHSAIATAVFREAADGAEFLKTVVQGQLGIPVQIISQDLEGEIGFKTAVTVAHDVGIKASSDSILCWDSGGGSFQLTGQRSDGAYEVWCGTLGSATVTAAMVEVVQGFSFSEKQSTNPCTKEQCIVLIEHVRDHIGRPPLWLRSRLEGRHAAQIVVGIGARAGAFGICAMACGTSSWDAELLWSKIAQLAGAIDSEIRDVGFATVSPILPKLVLVYSVMTTAGIPRVQYVESNGGCAGMHLCPQLWSASLNE